MSCNKYNIIWVERGIILSIIDYITQNYKKIQNKNIIIENIRYQTFIKILFPDLIFKPINHKSKNNFYFNIRKIIKKQDVIIDYLNNHNTINGKNIDLIPYYDYNDILVRFEVNKNKIPSNEIISSFKQFHHSNRCNYNNTGFIWDLIKEKQIINNLSRNNLSKFNKIFSLLNNYFFINLQNNTKIIPQFFPIIKYVYKNKSNNTTQNTTQNTKITNEKYISQKNFNEFLKIITKKINDINDSI